MDRDGVGTVLRSCGWWVIREIWRLLGAVERRVVDYTGNLELVASMLIVNGTYGADCVLERRMHGRWIDDDSVGACGAQVDGI